MLSQSGINRGIERQCGSTLAKTRGFMSGLGNNLTKTMRVRFLAGSGTEPKWTARQKPDHWWATQTRCYYWVWAYQPNLPRSDWNRSFRAKRRPTKVQKSFRSKWMASMSLIQIIPVQYWALFSQQSMKNLNMSVLLRRSGCWMRIQFGIQQMTVFQATSIHFQACPEQSFWRTTFWRSGSLWEGVFVILIWQQSWLQMK